MFLKYDGSVAAETGAINGVNLWASGPGQTINGGDKNDILGGAGNDVLAGGGGDNHYYLSGSGNVIVQGATGVNTVTTWQSYTLPENIQNLEVSGGYLYAAGNALDNLIKVGDTDGMTLYGAGGNNVLVGGAGTNTFVIDGTIGSNAIYGWHSGDAIRLLDTQFSTFAEVQAAMTQVGSDVVFESGQNSVVIRNATVSQFTAKDFYLALDVSKLGAVTFADEFDSLSLHTKSNPGGTWDSGYHYGGLGSYTLTGNNELQLYTSVGFQGTTDHDLGLNPFAVSDGVLTITAQKVDAATSAGMWNYNYSSGAITTWSSFSQLYGYFEMRAELPQGVKGAWPAFWMVPADGSWPPELDIMENLSGTPNIDYTTVHSSNGGHTSIGSANLIVDGGGYHTYGVLWTADTITWYLDGEAVFATATPSDLHKPMYMIANLAVGGWAGAPDFDSAQMKIDFIHAYALADGSSSWTSTVTPDPDAGLPTTGHPVVTDPVVTDPVVTDPTTPTDPEGPVDLPVSSEPDPVPSQPPAEPTPVVSTAAASYVAGAGVTQVTLTGSHQTVTGNDAGVTFVSNNTGNHLIGGTGADTFILGRGGDVVTGGAGADRFVAKETPWTGAHLTDFQAGQDVIDLTGLLAKSGYTGADAIADGYVKITADAGGAQIWSNLDKVSPGLGWWLVATVDGVAASSLVMDGAVVQGAPPVQPLVSTAAASYTAKTGVTQVTLTGSHQTVTGNDGGMTFVSNNTGNRLIGGAGADSFLMGRGGDTVTGGAGADRFVLKETPWAGGHVTDFQVGQDVIDLTGLLAKSGYAGTHAVADGYVKITASAGGAQIWSNLDKVSPGLGWWLAATVDGVSASVLTMQGGVVQGVTPQPPVSTAAASYAVEAGVTKVTLTGSHQTVTGNDQGLVFVSNNTGNHLVGGAGDDLFLLGRGGDVATGGAGADRFVFTETPWAAAHVTDFQLGQDVLDLTGLLAKSGYTGAQAMVDGYIKVTADSAGHAQVWSNLDHVSPGLGWWQVATLDTVSPASLHMEGAFITG